MKTMDSMSAESVIQGHPRYSAKVYFHQSRDFGKAYFDAGVLLDRQTRVEVEYVPGLYGIGEGVYVAAEDTAFEVATA